MLGISLDSFQLYRFCISVFFVGSALNVLLRIHQAISRSPFRLSARATHLDNVMKLHVRLLLSSDPSLRCFARTDRLKAGVWPMTPRESHVGFGVAFKG